MKRRMLPIVMMIAVVLLCMGCRNTSGTHSRKITDMKGRDIVLDGDVAAWMRTMLGQWT